MKNLGLVIFTVLLLIMGPEIHATGISCPDFLGNLAVDHWNHVAALRSAENTILIDFQAERSVPPNGLTGIQGPSSYQIQAKPVWVNFRNPELKVSDSVHVMFINYYQSTYRGEKMAAHSSKYEFDLQYAENGRFTGTIPAGDGLLIAYQKNDGYAVTREEIRQEIVVWVNGSIVKDPNSGNNFGLKMEAHIAQRRALLDTDQMQKDRGQQALQSEKSRSVVKEFFSNYGLIANWPSFQDAQTKLLTPHMTTIFSDHRGEKYYSGPSGYFSSLGDWSQVFSTLSEVDIAQRKKEGKEAVPFRVEIVQVEEGKVVARLHGTLQLKTPINGLAELRDDQHSWTETFHLNPQGHIYWLKVEMNILKK